MHLPVRVTCIEMKDYNIASQNTFSQIIAVCNGSMRLVYKWGWFNMNRSIERSNCELSGGKWLKKGKRRVIFLLRGRWSWCVPYVGYIYVTYINTTFCSHSKLKMTSIFAEQVSLTYWQFCAIVNGRFGVRNLLGVASFLFLCLANIQRKLLISCSLTNREYSKFLVSLL